MPKRLVRDELLVLGKAAPAVSAAGEVRLYFDSTSNKLLASENAGAYVNVVETLIQDAEDLVLTVRKGSAGTIAVGEAVHISGFAVGPSRPEVELADASAAGTMPAVGIARTAITSGADGTVVVSGEITGLDTSAFTAGDDLFISETAGALTTTKPTGTALIQKMGEVTRSNVANGTIQIFGPGRTNDLPNLPLDNVWVGNASAVPTPTATSALPTNAHAASHENGGSDEINVAGLSGLLADAQTPTAHALAGAEHTADTLANLNTKVSDATLIDQGRNLIAGAGLTGGGDLSADRTFDAVANADASIVVNANDIQVGVLATDAQHGVRGGGTQHADVVAGGADGFMTGADKTKLDGIEALADVTDATNVNAAGAVMETDYLAKGNVLAASAASTPVALAVGTNGQRLTADSAESTGMKWETPAVPNQMAPNFDANVAIFPASNPMQATSRNGHPLLAADDTTAESVNFVAALSEDYRSGDSLSVRIDWVAATATTGAVTWGVEVEANAPGGTDLDADSFDAQQTASSTTNATSGIITRTTISLTNAEADAIAAGDAFRLRLQRLPADVGDTMAGDAQVRAVMLVQ